MLMTINKAWLYGRGLDLPVKMEYDLTLAKKAYELAGQWYAARTTDEISKLNFTESDLQDILSTQICMLSSPQSCCTAINICMACSCIPRTSSTSPPLPSLLVDHLSTVYKFFTSPNTEIRFHFYQVALADPSSVAAKAFTAEATN